MLHFSTGHGLKELETPNHQTLHPKPKSLQPKSLTPILSQAFSQVFGHFKNPQCKISGIIWQNGKEHRNYHLGFSSSTEVVRKKVQKMATTLECSGFRDTVEIRGILMLPQY